MSGPLLDKIRKNEGLEILSKGISEQCLLLQYARQWLYAEETNPLPQVTAASLVRAEWSTESSILVIQLFDAGQIHRIFLSGWEHGIRWSTESQGMLQVMPSHADPGLPLFDVNLEWAKPWRETIPQGVQDILAQFVQGRWALLYWTSRYSSALDLLHSEPKLLWLLLMTGEQEGWSENKIAGFLRLKRRDQLKVCGLQSSKAALKLLGKCQLSPYGWESLSDLRAALADAETIHTLRHVPSLGSPTLRFMLQFPRLMRAPWVQAISDEPGHFFELKHMVADIHRLGMELNRGDVEEQMLRCRTLVELRRLHDRWVDQLNRDERRGRYARPSSPRPRNLAEWLWWPFSRFLNWKDQQVKRWSRWLSRYPAPPISGTTTIRPISTYRGLLAEGQSQRHCVAVYHERVLAGHYYVYQVLQPERCTLGLALSPGQLPHLDQLKGERNRVVSDATRSAVQSWLNQGLQPSVSERIETQLSTPERKWTGVAAEKCPT